MSKTDFFLPEKMVGLTSPGDEFSEEISSQWLRSLPHPKYPPRTVFWDREKVSVDEQINAEDL